MQVMVTLTANDSCPEMLAAIRRGPMSPPTTDEMIEYLLARKRRDQERPPYEHYSLEHVLSFQRRVKALKEQFFKRGESTPLGKVQDYWDRTDSGRNDYFPPPRVGSPTCDPLRTGGGWVGCPRFFYWKRRCGAHFTRTFWYGSYAAYVTSGAHPFLTFPGRLLGRNRGSGHAHRWSRRCRRAATKRTRCTIMLTSGGW